MLHLTSLSPRKHAWASLREEDGAQETETGHPAEATLDSASGSPLQTRRTTQMILDQIADLKQINQHLFIKLLSQG